MAKIRVRTLGIVPPDEVLSLEADEQRPGRLLCNLLGNACKSTQVGGWIRLGANVEDSMLVIRVQDNGWGIDEHAIPHVFDLFNREARLGAPAGFGVGLAVAGRIAERHGGYVEGRSAGRRAAASSRSRCRCDGEAAGISANARIVRARWRGFSGADTSPASLRRNG